MNKLGYEVGDTVYVFGRNRLSETRVVKVTPAGRMDLQYVDQSRPDGQPYVERWLPKGVRQVDAGNAWSYDHVVAKSEQEQRRTDWLRAEREKKARQKWREDVDALRARDLRFLGERNMAADALRAMLVDLENWP